MTRSACPLWCICPNRVSTVIKIIMSAIVVGAWLGVWPAVNQADGRDYSVSSSHRPVTEEEHKLCWLPYREVPNVAQKPKHDEAINVVSSPSAAWRAPSNTEPELLVAKKPDTKDVNPPLSDAPSAKPNDVEPLVDVAPYDEGSTGSYYSPGHQTRRWNSCNTCYQGEYDFYCRWYPSLHNRLWARGEYLLWWTQGSLLPPLVTTSTAGTQPNESGVLGQANTSILFGDDTVNKKAVSGGRISFGYWFDDCQSAGIETSYLGLGKERAHFSASNAGTPILARPFYDSQYNTQSAMLAAHPDFLEGTLNCTLKSQFQAVEVLLRRNVVRREWSRLDFLVGWRLAQLDESFRVDQFSEWTETQGPIIDGTTKALTDLFDVSNQFNGAEFGFVYREQAGPWSLEALMKLSLGSTHSRVLINGSTTTTVPNAGSSSFTGDLLAQETNIGRYSRDHFAVMPEIGITLSYALTQRLKASFGYSFLYWSQVARTAEQIDTYASQLPPEAPTGSHQPAFDFTMTDYWAQGMNFGLEYQF